MEEKKIARLLRMCMVNHLRPPLNFIFHKNKNPCVRNLIYFYYPDQPAYYLAEIAHHVIHAF